MKMGGLGSSFCVIVAFMNGMLGCVWGILSTHSYTLGQECALYCTYFLVSHLYDVLYAVLWISSLTVFPVIRSSSFMSCSVHVILGSLSF